MPSTATDRLNGLTTSVAVKPPCVVVALTNLTLAGLQTVNGVALAQDDRVLVTGQANAALNGIYTADSGDWLRARDFDGARDAVSGTLVLVRGAGAAEGSIYELTSTDPISFGSSALTFRLRYGANIRYDQTQTEALRGITPVEYGYPPGHARRYGLLGDGTNESARFNTWLDACSGAPYIAFLPRANLTKYVIGPTLMRSDLHILCARNVVVEAAPGFTALQVLLDFTGQSAITIEGNGAVFRMLKAEYVSGEFRHCIRLATCADVRISEITARDSGGDGFYINGVTNCWLHNITADNNRRQGCSVIKADGLTGTGVWLMKNSTGTAPMDGFCIEPNSPSDLLRNVHIQKLVCENNVGNGMTLYLDDYKTGAPVDVSITIDTLVSRGNWQAARIKNLFVNAGSYGGFVRIGAIVSENDRSNALGIIDKSVAGPFLEVGSVTAVNPCTGASAFADTAAVYLADTSATITGGISIGAIDAKATHADMDYAVIMEMGQGFSNVRAALRTISGYQQAPARLNNTTAIFAEASNAIIDVRGQIDKLAFTASTAILATLHFGRLITNAGAGNLITFALREYLPRGNVYRFRVESAQPLRISTYDPTDHIAGTTAVGQTVTSSDIGASAEVQYLGTIAGLRTWQLIPLGNPASWTWT